MTDAIYLDCNATTPLKPAVVAAMSAALGEVGNASSVHRFGRPARRLVEEARAKVANLVGTAPRQVVFTSGGTEANNQALIHNSGRVLVSAVEHDSVLKSANAETIPVDSDGRVDLAALEGLLANGSRKTIVAVMLANNETGVVQPVAKIALIAKAYGAQVHCDAVQAAGKVAIDMKALGVDTLALSAHKFGGPQGVGALVVRDGAEMAPLLKGGGQEQGRRAGTENVAAIHGFGVAAELALREMDAMEDLARLREAMEARLTQATPAVVFSAGAERLPNTSCIAMPGVSAETQVMAFDLAGIAVSAGSACSSGKIRPSHVLQAMGVVPELAGSAIRISTGWATTAAQTERFVDQWIGLWARLGARDGRSAPAA
jgi:cysteine desulfurase